MKKYYPNSIPFVIKHTKSLFKDLLLEPQYKDHYIAFKQIEEYQ